jgi:2-succinyl-5-enolpyruvyl-6-hydroxy-3-cyclohexene-1-carboxylate synthase
VNPSTALARVLVDELARAGVAEAVLAPGSRSAPLAFALHAADAGGRLRLHVRVDERTAGFLALGLAKTGGGPVVVVTTSGTAVGNLLPAVMEASHAGLPLVVLSADRPAELRDAGANQTTDQVRIFGGFVRWSADIPPSLEPGQGGYWRRVVGQALAASAGARTNAPGPVHVNVQLAEPLVPGRSGAGLPESPQGRPDGLPWTQVETAGRSTPVVLPAGPRTVVVAGDDAGPRARLLAESAGWPLLAEPTSGARTGTHALRCYRLLLTDESAGGLAGRIQRVVVLGHPTLSRPVSRLLARPDVEVVVVAPYGRDWPDAGQTATRVVRSVRAEQPDDPPDHSAWLDAWLRADRAVGEAVDQVVGSSLSAYSLAKAVHAAVPPAGLLVVGSSNPIRDLDLMAVPHPVGERRKVIANRGLSGIDGTVSTAVGAALARPDSSRCLAYMGDLTFLHDSNGLLIGPGEPRPDLTIVVANDDGGSIFGLLEQGAAEYAGAFERLFGTPHHADLAALCTATATPYQRISTLPDLRAALERPADGIEVLEVPIDRVGRRELEARLRQAAAPAVPPRLQ